MRRDKIAFYLVISGLLAVIIYASCRMLDTGKTEEEYTVSVIVDHSSSDRWTAFRQGLEQGASEGKLYLNFISTDAFHSVTEETELIRKEVENGVNGLIVEPFSSEPGSELEGLLPKNSTVLICTDIPGEKQLDVIMPDWRQMGIALAESVNKTEKALREAFFSVIPQDAVNREHRLRVGILSGNQRQLQMSYGLQGLKEELDDTIMEITWVSSSQALENVNGLKRQMEAKSADILISLDDEMTRLAVNYLKSQENNTCRLYAVGRSEQSIACLDEGWIQALIVPDEYYMGYACARTIQHKLQFFMAETGAKDVPFVSVTKENLYDEQNATLLFPVIR